MSDEPYWPAGDLGDDPDGDNMSDEEPIKTVGPILACESAIQHYDKRLDQLREDESKILKRLMHNRREQEALRNSKSQWRHALDALKRVAAAPDHCPDCGLTVSTGFPHFCPSKR